MWADQDPPEGGRVRRNWTNERLKGGGSFVGWITGKAQWIETHYVYRTIPCRSCLTKGKLQCQIDHGRYVVMWRGYLPLVRESGKPVFVVVQDYSAEDLKGLVIGTQVTCKRDAGGGKEIQVIKCLKPEPLKGLDSKRVDPWQFKWCLLRIWGDAELALYFGVRGVKNKAVFPERPDTDEEIASGEQSDGDITSVNQTTSHLAPGATPESITDVLSRFMPKSNGKH